MENGEENTTNAQAATHHTRKPTKDNAPTARVVSVVSMRKLRYGLIGCGRRAAAHLPAAAVMKDIYDFAAVCDILPEAARKVAQRYNVKAYTDIEQMLKKEKLDVLDVVVPVEAHHVVSTFAMEQGVNVICETPIARARRDS